MTQPCKPDILHLSLHGLIRGENLELGRDPDTGGQCLYVLELVKALARNPEIGRVSLITRRVHDSKVSPDYAVEREVLGDNAEILRIEAGPRRYLRKEVLWRHLDAFIDGTLAMLRREKRLPDLIHAHYADAGYVGRQLAAVLGCPFVFTGHSLGRCKRNSLIEGGGDPDDIDRRYNLAARIEAEELSLDTASIVCTSTRQEVDEQYSLYDQHSESRMRVIPPGVDLSRFNGPNDPEMDAAIGEMLTPFLRDHSRPPVLTIARADERKNLPALVRAFSRNRFLREHANLIIIGGNRDSLEKLSPGARKVWNELLRCIDDGGLYGIAAYPKNHQSPQIAGLYRWAAARGGVFVNPAFTEPFGLTLLEAAAAGLPLVATNDGGPRDILANCQNGTLIDPNNDAEIGEAIAAILADPAKQKHLSETGHAGVRKHYSWDSHVAGYLKEIRKILPDERPIRKASSRGAIVERERWIVMDLLPKIEEQPAELVRRWTDLFEHNPEVGFGIATGVSFDEAWQIIRRCNMPEPGFVISGLGAEIRYGKSGVPDERWPQQISHRWNRQAVVDALKKNTNITMQPDAHQNRFKVSYFLDQNRPTTRTDIQRCLREAGISAKVIVSARLLVDILPVRSGKDVALRYIEHRWGIPPERIFYFGTYANDLSAVRGRNLATLAGDADRVLRQIRPRPRLYHAKTPGLIGFFEGLDHFEFLQASSGSSPPPAQHPPVDQDNTEDLVHPVELHP
ncbi:MAG: HAD family hydrolase [Luteolibacter sp.]